MVNHNEVIKNYFEAVDRIHYNKSYSVYFENDTLYSYGYHFILAQKIKNGYLLNGDSYSTITAKHQAYTRYRAPDNSPIIPFSALQQILTEGKIIDIIKELRKIELIDKTEDTYTEYTYKNKDGNEQTGQHHHLGAALIKYRNKFYLSSIDPGSKNHQYFLVELPKNERFNNAPSVKAAFRLLANNLNDTEYDAYLQGRIKRQGEYFLIPSFYTTKQIKRLGAITPRKIKRGYDLSNGVGNAHIATETICVNDCLYIRGTLRHNEHKMISLGKTWHKVIKNTAVKSFTASGNVD